MTDAVSPGKGQLLLRLEGISKSFGAVSALSDIALEVHAKTHPELAASLAKWAK
mgnify:CR=1 FL=1